MAIVARRVRRHRRARHDGGPARGDRRRDHRRVRRRGAAGRAARRTAAARARPHADRRRQRAARRRTCRRRSGTPSVGSCSTRSATCPSRASACRSTGVEFCAERVQGRRIVSVLIRLLEPHEIPSEDENAAAELSESSDRVPVGVRVGDRPAERREVDAREPARRAQGVDRLRPAADHAHADPRRPHDRDGHRSCSSTRPACTSRAPCSASARTTAPCRRWPRSTSSASSSTRRPPSVRATGSSPSSSTQVATPTMLVVNKVDRGRARRHRASGSATASELGDFAAFVPFSAAHRRRDRRARRRARAPACPRARTTTRTASCRDQPESFLVAELVREKLLAVTRDELPHSIAVTTEEIEERETKPTVRCSRCAWSCASSASRRRGS